MPIKIEYNNECLTMWPESGGKIFLKQMALKYFYKPNFSIDDNLSHNFIGQQKKHHMSIVTSVLTEDLEIFFFINVILQQLTIRI